jgi:hypothetical protein
MTDETTTAPVTEQAPPTGAPATEPTQEGGEDWQKRMSGMQRAHNEETRVLREQVAALQAAATQTTQQASQQTSTLSEEAQAYKRQADEAQKALQAERQTRIVETRSIKYPYAAETLGDPGVLLSMDEAKLAGLNARLAPSVNPRSGLMDANGAARTGPEPEKPLAKKTSAELKADLARLAPAWSAEVKEAMGS